MNTTGNYKLKKPEGTDVVNIDDLNGNADLIDAGMKKNSDGINTMKQVKAATLTAAGWSGAAPFTQTVAVAGITAADTPIVSLRITDGTAAATVKAQNKAYGCVDRAVTGAGNITFYCYNKRPAADFAVAVKGV